MSCCLWLARALVHFTVQINRRLGARGATGPPRFYADSIASREHQPALAESLLSCRHHRHCVGNLCGAWVLRALVLLIRASARKPAQGTQPAAGRVRLQSRWAGRLDLRARAQVSSAPSQITSSLPGTDVADAAETGQRRAPKRTLAYLNEEAPPVGQAADD
jgi:hypothetical protein